MGARNGDVSSMPLRKTRLVVAGAVPPPIGGQAVMIARIISDLQEQKAFEVVHLPFFFTRNVRRTRRAGLGKVFELFAVLGRLARIRTGGVIDALLYPVGGPQFVPLVRDVCLLPWFLLASRKVILHFHAGGIAETIDDHPFLLSRIVRFLYRKAAAAIVMTEFGRRDATSLGIKTVKVVPHTLDDAFDPELVDRGELPSRLLYVGHLSQEKGTPALLEAFAVLRQNGSDCVLELVGECLPDYGEAELKNSIARLGIQDAVQLAGVLSGPDKWRRFGRADLFIFPSLAPESFGLVTAEAMMWALPVVACDWRGNREVLGEGFGGICFDPGTDLGNSLTLALREAIVQRDHWKEWGERNRRNFENRYKADRFPARLAEALRTLV
jgi:glycosyltransferase involved in cell wall biosynthesis